MVTIKDGCGCDPCGCDWKQKLKEAYSRAIQSVNKIGDETGRVYFPDGTGFVKVPLLTKEQIDSIAEIDGIKASVDNLNVTVPALETQVTGVTGSLVSNVKVLNGTTAGKFKVRIEREKAALIDSNDYDLSKVNSIELIQGSGPAMVKAQLTLSDGTVLRSDDFLFTAESIGTDVYISSFTFKAGNVAGTISADIGLNNGVTIEANNFLVPTDPNIISGINDLNTRVSAIEGDSGLNGLKAAVADLQTNKADVDNSNQNITVNSIIGKSLYAKTDASSGYAVIINNVPNDENTPIRVISQIDRDGSPVGLTTGYVAMLDADRKPKNFTAGGSTIVACPLNFYDFRNALVQGCDLYGQLIQFLNSDTNIIADIRNPSLKCTTLSEDKNTFTLIGICGMVQMGGKTLYRASITIDCSIVSGSDYDVIITANGPTSSNQTATNTTVQVSLNPMSTTNNAFIKS